MIRQDFIQRLLLRADLPVLLSEHITLKKSGARFEALCPFHEEKSPSFKVYVNDAEADHYRCFGCGKHGNALDFLMEQVGMPFVDAVRSLASRTGMVVEYEEKPAAAEQPNGDDRERRRRVLGMLSRVATVFQEELTSPTAVAAKEELDRRGIGATIIDRYGIGFAPAGWNRLTGDSSFFWTALLEAGLAARNDPKKRPYDFFRDRLMFPIRDRRGTVVAFGGRRLNDGEGSGPKYLNTPETIVYRKGQELFGLYQAMKSIQQSNAVIVTEGYFDVITPAQHGVENCVSTCGTALTEMQRDLLLRCAGKLFFCFDGDRAGKKATWRAAEMLLGAVSDEQEVRLCTMPADHDPDSFVRECGADAFRALLDRAPTLCEYVASGLISLAKLASPEGKSAFVRQAVRYYTKFNAPILAFFFKKHICAAAEIREDEFDDLAARTPARGD